MIYAGWHVADYHIGPASLANASFFSGLLPLLQAFSLTLPLEPVYSALPLHDPALKPQSLAFCFSSSFSFPKQLTYSKGFDFKLFAIDPNLHSSSVSFKSTHPAFPGLQRCFKL